MTDESSIMEEKPGTRATKGITFKCRLCGKAKGLGEMRVLERFFPPIVVCGDCERKMR
jgi:hypothetical protein